VIAYLRANWKQLAGVAVAAAALGWFAHRPAQMSSNLCGDATLSAGGPEVAVPA
jgi:hypothetical protein